MFAYFWTHAAFSEASIARSCCSIDFVLSCWMLDLTTSTDFVFWFLHPPFLNVFFFLNGHIWCYSEILLPPCTVVSFFIAKEAHCSDHFNCFFHCLLSESRNYHSVGNCKDKYICINWVINNYLICQICKFAHFQRSKLIFMVFPFFFFWKELEYQPIIQKKIHYKKVIKLVKYLITKQIVTQDFVQKLVLRIELIRCFL